MNVFVNNEKYNLSDKSTLGELLYKLKMKSFAGIALAVNDKVVPKPKWDSFKLQDKDKITLISATQGG